MLLSSSAALPLKVYFKKEVKKLKDIFRQAPTIADADVVVVHDIFECSESPAALAARLFGKWLADETWLNTGMRAGSCLAFFHHAQKSTFKFYLSDVFCKESPEHAKVLLEAHDANRKFRKKGDTKTKFKVKQKFKESKLQKPPKSLFGIIASTEDFAGKQFLKLPGLIQLLSQRARRCEYQACESECGK